ncbi:hypothetical protein GK109_00320 [Pseudarthrobacter sp. GA104]|nr:hypothetical protein [Pseudarthrobacter sp. GA104]MUU69694.1 hypothetical protein [Pseudarthrobacter sp. GA104]
MGLDDATGTNEWWRHYSDQHMRVLLYPQGPSTVAKIRIQGSRSRGAETPDRSNGSLVRDQHLRGNRRGMTEGRDQRFYRRSRPSKSGWVQVLLDVCLGSRFRRCSRHVLAR